MANIWHDAHIHSKFLVVVIIVFSERELTLTFSICYRRPVCLSSLCNVVQPTQPVEIFGNVSSPFGTLAIC